jgi:hypothetical protein
MIGRIRFKLINKGGNMDIGKLMQQQIDSSNYTRWKSAHDTYKELAGFITRKLDTPGYNKLDIGADIMKHMVEEIKKYEELMNRTEMGKTMKELGTK